MLLRMFLVLLLAAPAMAAPLPAGQKTESTIAKVRSALQQKVTIKAENKSFNETIEMFKEQLKIDIQLDAGSLQNMGMSPDQQSIKFDVKDVTVREALQAAFGKFNLRYGVVSTGLVISTEEGVINRQMRQRVSLDGDRSLAAVLKGLIDDTGVNVITDPRIAKKVEETTVQLKLEDVPVETAVRLSADVGGFRVIRLSNVLYVTNDDRAEKLKNDADRPVGPIPGSPVFPIDGGIPFPVPGGAGGVVPGVVPPPPPAIQIVPAVEAPPAKPPVIEK